nr:uncharacterized protein LOC127491527 [Oryctolagus cuniculus]
MWDQVARTDDKDTRDSRPDLSASPSLWQDLEKEGVYHTEDGKDPRTDMPDKTTDKMHSGVNSSTFCPCKTISSHLSRSAKKVPDLSETRPSQSSPSPCLPGLGRYWARWEKDVSRSRKLFPGTHESDGQERWGAVYGGFSWSVGSHPQGKKGRVVVPSKRWPLTASGRRQRPGLLWCKHGTVRGSTASTGRFRLGFVGVPFFLVGMHPARRRYTDLGERCFKKMDSSHSSLKPHLLPLSQNAGSGVSAPPPGRSPLLGLLVQPCNLQRPCKGPSSSPRSVAVTPNHACPQTVWEKKTYLILF